MTIKEFVERPVQFSTTKSFKILFNDIKIINNIKIKIIIYREFIKNKFIVLILNIYFILYKIYNK